MEETKKPVSIDVRNARHRMEQLVDNGEDWTNAFIFVSNKMDLTAKEMDQLEKIIPYQRS